MATKGIKEYFKGSLEEMSKVTWPTSNQAVRLTIIVLIFCAVFAATVGGLDYLLNQLFNFILSVTA